MEELDCLMLEDPPPPDEFASWAATGYMFDNLFFNILSLKSLFLGSASQFRRNPSSAHYPSLKLDVFQGRSYAATAQIFILHEPLLFLSFCQHFRKFTLQTQVTPLEIVVLSLLHWC